LVGPVFFFPREVIFKEVDPTLLIFLVNLIGTGPYSRGSWYF